MSNGFWAGTIFRWVAHKECVRSSRWELIAFLLIGAIGPFLILASQTVLAQGPSPATVEPTWDRVQYREPSHDHIKTVLGLVVELQAKHLELKLRSGTVRRIPRAEIVSIELLNQTALAKANEHAASGKFEEARQGFELVVRGNVPHWMKRYAAARRIQCLRALQQHRAAVADFVNLAKDDPEQIPFEALPVVWTSPVIDTLMEEQVNAWLASDNEWERLSGASLGLLHPPTAAASQKVLEAFLPAGDTSSALDPLPAIATAQLWRLPQNRSTQQLQQMQTQLNVFPDEAKAGPLLVMGKLWKNAGEAKLAADTFLQLAVLYPDQHDLVLLGLEAAYYTLRDVDRDDAARVGEWLVARHPDAAQTEEIRKELGL